MRELLLVGGQNIRVEEKSYFEPKMARELFFTGDDSTFGVRYTDGSEKTVESTPENRELYTAMIEVYRERMDNLLDRRE